MRAVSPTSDYLQMRPVRALGAICFPLFFVNVVSLCSSVISSSLYSRYAGQSYFTVAGYLSVVITLFVNIVAGVYTASWVKIAHHHALHDKATFTRSFQNALFTMFLAVAVAAPVFILLCRPVLHALSVPEAFWQDAKLYYILYLGAYLPSALAALCLTVVNGISTSRRIFWVNIFVIAANLAATALLLAVFRLKLVGAILCSAGGAILHLIFYWVLFRRDGYFRNTERFRPDWQLVGTILRYSAPIIFQSTLCTISYLIVSLQTNRLLSSNYITVLSVDLPLSGMMSAFSSAILAFCPQNFGAARFDRLKRFLRLAVGCALVYGVCCLLIYSTLGSWYYGRLFSDPEIIEFGREYWFWRGVGFIPLAIIFTVRYFLDSVGMSRLSMLSGVGEFIGNILCAFWVIPVYGNIGRSVSYTLGYTLGACMLLIAYLTNRRKIFRSPESRGNTSE